MLSLRRGKGNCIACRIIVGVFPIEVHVYIYITHRRNALPHKYIRGVDLQRSMGWPRTRNRGPRDRAEISDDSNGNYDVVALSFSCSIDRRTTRRGEGEIEKKRNYFFSPVFEI